MTKFSMSQFLNQFKNQESACLKANIRTSGDIDGRNLELMILFLEKTYHPEKHFSPNHISVG